MFTTMLNKIAQAPAHESCSYIFECKSGSVEKLKSGYLLIYTNKRKIEVDSFSYYLLQNIFGNSITNERPDNRICDFFLRVLAYVADEILRQLRQLFRKV